MKYLIIADTWAFVEADSVVEALDKVADGEFVYEEEKPVEAYEVYEFFANR